MSRSLSSFAVVGFFVFVKFYMALSPSLQFSLFPVCSMAVAVFVRFWLVVFEECILDVLESIAAVTIT